MAAAHHGSTPAAWTGVALVLLGFLIGAAGLVMQNWLVFWIGVGVVAAALVVSKVLVAVGLGGR
jgi:hypothetical protein